MENIMATLSQWLNRINDIIQGAAAPLTELTDSFGLAEYRAVIPYAAILLILILISCIIGIVKGRSVIEEEPVRIVARRPASAVRSSVPRGRVVDMDMMSSFSSSSSSSKFTSPVSKSGSQFDSSAFQSGMKTDAFSGNAFPQSQPQPQMSFGTSEPQPMYQDPMMQQMPAAPFQQMQPQFNAQPQVPPAMQQMPMTPHVNSVPLLNTAHVPAAAMGAVPNILSAPQMPFTSQVPAAPQIPQIQQVPAFVPQPASQPAPQIQMSVGVPAAPSQPASGQHMPLPSATLPPPSPSAAPQLPPALQQPSASVGSNQKSAELILSESDPAVYKIFHDMYLSMRQALNLATDNFDALKESVCSDITAGRIPSILPYGASGANDIMAARFAEAAYNEVLGPTSRTGNGSLNLHGQELFKIFKHSLYMLADTGVMSKDNVEAKLQELLVKSSSHAAGLR